LIEGTLLLFKIVLASINLSSYVWEIAVFMCFLGF
jgi:hypothetical protein